MRFFSERGEDWGLDFPDDFSLSPGFPHPPPLVCSTSLPNFFWRCRSYMQNQINKAKEEHQCVEREKVSPILKKLSALLGFPGGSGSKESACNAETWFHPWVRKIPWEGTLCPLQYSCLGYPMDRGAWQAWPSVYQQSMVSFSAAILNMERTLIPILIHTQSLQNDLN